MGKMNITNMVGKKKIVKSVLFGVLVFLLSLICQVSNMFRKYNIALVTDRIGDLATPSYLAGLDFSNLISISKYYGYGFKWIYFVFFKLTDNPYVIYALIILFNAALLSLLNVIIMWQISRVSDDDWNIMDIAILLIIFSCNSNANPLSSEPTLFFAMDVLMIFIVETYKHENKRNYFFSGVVAFWLCYMLTLHERCLAVVIGFLIAIFFDYYVVRKTCLDWKVFSVSFLVFYIIKKVLTSRIIDFFWQNQEDLANTSVVPTNMTKGFGLDYVLVIIKSSISNLVCLTEKSYGIGILFFVLSIYLLKKIILNDLNREKYCQYRGFIIVFLTSVIAILITILGLGVKSAKVVNGLYYPYKHFTFIRYYQSWMPVGMVSAFAIVRGFSVSVKVVDRIKVVFGCGLAYKYFYEVLLPILEYANKVAGSVISDFRFYLACIFSNTVLMKASEYRSNFIYSFVISIVIMILILSNKKLQRLGVVIAFCVMMWNQTAGFNLRLPYFWSNQDIVYDAVKNVEETFEIQDVIYCPDGNSSKACTLQYLLNRYSIHIDYPDETAGINTLVVTWETSDECQTKLKESGYAPLMLKKDYYIWSKNEDILRMIENGLIKDDI